MINPPGLRSVLIAMLSCFTVFASAQVRIVSLGLYTGLTSTHTWDEGINADPRYKVRYKVKFSPIGFNYGVDYEGFGFLISPGLLTTGQDFFVVNTQRGEEGTRKINLHYFNVPVSFKIHLIDIDFLKTSFLFGAGPAFLINGKEEITHHAAKYYFPPAVYPIVPDSYTVENDGVLAPRVDKLRILQKNDFDPLQIFALIGFRSDWFFSENWKASFDVRASYTVFDNRSDAYMQKLQAYRTLYDIPGNRKDIVGSFTIAISRYIELDVAEKTRKIHIKNNTKKHVPPKKIEKAPSKKRS